MIKFLRFLWVLFTGERVKGHLHIVSSDDVKSQNHLLHALAGAEHSLVAFVQDQVDGLIEAFQSSLQTNTHTHSYQHKHTASYSLSTTAVLFALKRDQFFFSGPMTIISSKGG